MKNVNSTFISSSFGLSWLRTSLNVAAFACASLLVITSLADAGGAQGARVRRGNVSFSQDGNRLVVRASNGAIIEYDRLSIEAGQIMQFIQPSSSSRVLNRVTGSELTRIDGTLLSNGIVYLVNPQGFRIGGGAVINVGGFFAAAGAMSNSDFVAGRNRFTNLVGEVTNEGLIQAKSVALVGQYVANRGTIDVGDGYVAMGAGDKVFIQDGTGPVVVTVSRSQMGADGSGAGTKAAISNTGTIDAGEGSVTMANGDFYSLAMDLSGTIVGKSIAARGGKGGVLAVNGTLDASSSTGKGGTIDVFGDRVGLFGDALVNANGATGGGSVRIGGDYLGSNAANAPQASRTFIGSDASITANATQSGDGGRVIVWSNEYTGFFGTIEASAAASGKGGFVETSSHDNLQAFGSVDASSALGQAGTWLLDPSDVVIAEGSAGSLSDGVFDPAESPAFIGVVQINAALNAGTSVIINTESADAGAGNITMTGAISKTAGGNATLTLNARGTIVLSQSISSTTGALSVELEAYGSVTMNSIISTNGGNLQIVCYGNAAAGSVTQGADSVLTIGGTTFILAGGEIALVGAGTNNFVGVVRLDNQSGGADASVSSNTALTLGEIRSVGNFTATTTSSINVVNWIRTLWDFGSHGGTVTLNGAAGLTIGVLGVITSDGAVNLTGGGTGISIRGDITTTGDVVNFNSATTMGGSIAVNTGPGAGDINFLSTLDLFFYNLTLTAGTGSVAFTGAVGDAPGNAIGTITINSAFNVTAASINAASFRQLAGTGATTFNGAQTYSALAGLNVVTSGTIALNNSVTTIPPTGGNFGNVTLNGAAGLTIGALGDITSDGAVNLTGGGSGINTAGDITTTGDVVNFNSATTMDGSIAVNTGAGAGDINFASTLDLNPNSLTLNAGTGSVTFTGPVGEAPGAAVGTITINSAFNVTAASINAASFRQLAGTGATTFNGAQTYSALAGLNVVTSGTIALNNTVTTIPPTGGNFGNVTLNGGAGLTIGALGDITSDGAVNLTGGGSAGISTAGDITTTGDVVNFNSATTMDGSIAVDTGAGAGDINFASTLDLFFYNLTLTAGTGSVAFTGAVGDAPGNAIGTITINSAFNVTAASINAASFRQLAGTGATTFNGAQTYSALAGLNVVTSGTIALNNSVTTIPPTGGNFGNVTLNGAAGLTIGALGDITSDGAVNLTGGGSAGISTAGDITTTGAVVNFNSATILTGNVSIDTTDEGNLAGQDVGFAATVTDGDAAFNLNLNAGTDGVINFSGANAAGLITINNLTITNASGANFAGNVQINDLITTANPYSVSLTGTQNTFTQQIDFLNTGVGSSVTLGNVAGSTFDLLIGLSFTGNAALNLAATIRTTGDAVNFGTGGVTLFGNSSVDTTIGGSPAGAAILFAGALNGIQALTLTAGAGTISFSGLVGDSQALASLTVVSAGDISIGNAMEVTGAVSITGNSGVDIFLGTAGAGLSLTNAELDLITEAGSLAITATGVGASITVNGVMGGGDVHGVTLLTSNVDGVLFVTTASTFSNSLAVVANDVAVNALLGVTGSLSFTGNSGVNVIVGSGGVSTNLILSNAELARLTASSGLNVTATGAGATLNVNGVTVGGAITGTTTLSSLQSTITFLNTASTFSNSLALVANNVDVNVALGVTGSISFTGNSGVDVFLGVSGPGLNLTNAELARLTASSGMNVTATGLGSSMTVNGVTGGGAITGTTTLSSDVDGVTFATTASTFNNALAVVGLTTIAGVNITTSSDSITFSGQVLLTTAGVSINTVSGDITFSGALNGSQALTLTAGAGNITFTGAVGDTTTLASLTVVSAGDISIGNTMKVNGAVSITGNSGVDIFLGTDGAGLSLTNAELDFITEAGSLAITATGAGASITVNGVTGGGNFDGVTRLASTDDKISFETTASTFDNSLTVVVSDLDIAVAIGVTGSMSIIGNTGVDIFNGTGGAGLSVTNAELALLTANNLNITSVGPLSSFIIEGVTGGGTISGTTTLTGSNGVTFKGTSSFFNSALKIASIATIESVGVTSTAGGIEFSNSVTLSGPGTSTITSRGIAGDIINVVGPIIAIGDDSQALIVNAGAGEISFGGDIGALTKRLSALTLTATNTTFAGDVFVVGDLNVGNISLTGPTTLETNGLLTVGTIVGVGFALDLVANAISITNTISNVSVLTIRNVALDGDISIGGIATFDISQGEWDLIQSSVNSVVLGSLVNTGAITVAGPWINNRAVTVDFLSGGAGEFNIDGNITGSGSLTVNGSGNSTHINADLIQAFFIYNDSVVVEGGVTRTLTATGALGIVIDSTGFAPGISADSLSTSLALLTTSAGAPINITGTFTTAAGFALNNLTLGGNGAVDAGTITLSASGAIAGNLSIDLAAGINLNSNAGTLTAASMFFGEDTTLTGATILAATVGDINFGTDPATATLGGAFGITLTLTASGNATFTDLITLTGAAGLFAFTGNNLTLNGVGTNAIGNTMTVTNAGLFTTYNGGLAPTGADLVVGSDFVQNGTGLNSIGGNITSTNDGISFATGVTLTNNVTMTSGLLAGDDISFATAIRSDVSTTRDLTLTAGLGDIALNDGTSTTTLLDAILINSARNVVVGDAITATSFIQLAGTGSTTFSGTLLLTGALTVNAGTSLGNTITFASTVGSVTASSVNLNTLASSARATPATVATIVSGGNITFSSGTFDMGLNQKLTGLGNITIGGLLPATNATTVTLGDVNAVGNLSVNSDAINLRARASGPILTNTGGTITDLTVDYIVGGRVFFSVAPVMVGSGGRAVFANTSGNIDANGTLGGFVTSIYQSPITVALLTGTGGQILDLSVANTVALFNPANIIPPQMSILPPIGLLGSSDELEQNKKKKAKPEAQGSKKTASETPKTAPGIPVALR